MEEFGVRWPVARLSLESETDKTYPEVPVRATLEFPAKKCEVAAGAANPELWLELVYCGHSLPGCLSGNTTHAQVSFMSIVKGNTE